MNNSSRLSDKLNKLKQSGKKALVAYIVAGDPQPELTVPLMHKLAASGVDVIELGVPFSDPEAEGPVIQLAHQRALKFNISLNDCLTMVAKFREQDKETPVVLMGYLNPIEAMGYGVFATRARDAGVNGTIIVNLPPEEAGELGPLLAEHHIDTVYLLAPTTTDDRALMIVEQSRGFVYYVSLKGTTGAASLDVDDVATKMARFRPLTSLPIMVGFGINDAPSARAVVDVADGAVVGSAIVKLMQQHQDDGDALLEAVGEFAASLRAAID